MCSSVGTPTDNNSKIVKISLCLGTCVQTSDGKLTHTSCLRFSSGCPGTPYITSDFYKCK